MKVFFPQWQGAGDLRLLSEGAHRIRDRLGDDHALESIDGFTDLPSEKEHGILHYASVVQNLRAFRDHLDRARPSTVFTLGGDCSADIVPAAYLFEHHARDVSLVWFDAHADANTPASSPSGTLHGMPVRILLGDGDPALCACAGTAIAPGDLVYAGVRELDPSEAELLDRCRIRRITVEAIRADPIGALDTLLRHTKRKVYVHIDLDVLEPAGFSGLACPVAGGLDEETVLLLVAGLQKAKVVVGGSVVEWAGEGAAEAARAAAVFTSLVEG
jgi:arginase